MDYKHRHSGCFPTAKEARKLRMMYQGNTRKKKLQVFCCQFFADRTELECLICDLQYTEHTTEQLFGKPAEEAAHIPNGMRSTLVSRLGWSKPQGSTYSCSVFVQLPNMYLNPKQDYFWAGFFLHKSVDCYTIYKVLN